MEANDPLLPSKSPSSSRPPTPLPLPSPPPKISPLAASPQPRRPITLLSTALTLVSTILILLLLSSTLIALPPCNYLSEPCRRGFSSRFSLDLAQASNPRWMSALRDDAPLQELSIPGTHDSLTYGIKKDLVHRCQNTELEEQLEAGIRYLDVRLRVWGGRLWVFHADVYAGFSFEDVLGKVLSFLEENEGEGVVMRVKEEGPPWKQGGDGEDEHHDDDDDDADDDDHEEEQEGDRHDDHDEENEDEDEDDDDHKPRNSRRHDDQDEQSFSDIFNLYLSSFPIASRLKPHLFLPSPSTNATFPTLSSLRSRILILQDFPSPSPLSYPWSPTPDSGFDSPISLEDLWDLGNVTSIPFLKWPATRENLMAAAAAASSAEDPDPMPLFISHTSASVGVLPIEAALGPRNHSVTGMNELLGMWLEQGVGQAGGAATAGRTGIVVMDFPGARLVDDILKRNKRLEKEG